MSPSKIQYADDDRTSIAILLKMRIPSLVMGLVMGLLLSLVASRFEAVLGANIAVAYFIPFIVYLAAAVGSQTQEIYVRDLKSGKANFKTYLFKESILGIVLGLVFGLVICPIVLWWFDSADLSIAVALGAALSVASAPLIALLVTEALELEREDPAVWSGPLATVIQDTVSVLMYGLIASAILL